MLERSAKKRLALTLFDVGAFKTKCQSPGGEGFLLKAHEDNPDLPRSPFYLNLRTPENPKPGPLTSEIVREISARMYDYVRIFGIRYVCVAGIPHAGDPFAEVFVMNTPRYESPVLLRLEKEDASGYRRVVKISSGAYEPGETVLLIDDLITAAHSKHEAIDVLEIAGLLVQDILVLVDRQQGGTEDLKRDGYRVHSIFTISELLDCYRASHRITQDEYIEICQYLGR